MRLPILFIVALLLSVDFARAQEPPKRKSGLWEITRTSTYTGNQPRRIRVCIDQASDNALQQLAEGMRGEACTTDKLSHDGDKLVVEATCKLRSSTAQTHAVISGKFDSAYSIESKSTYKPPLARHAAGHTLLVAKWSGPCAAGPHPGEAILDNGAKVDSDGEAEAPKVKKTKPSTTQKSNGGVPGIGATPGIPPLRSQPSVAPAPPRTQRAQAGPSQ